MDVTNYIVRTGDFSDADIADAHSALPDIKKKAADRILAPQKRAESILGAFLGYYALLCESGGGFFYPDKSGLLSQAAAVSRFAKKAGWPVGDHGKPFPDGADVSGKVKFVSISHSGGYVAAAASDKPVGADVQALPADLDRLMRIAARFHPDERAWLEGVEQKDLAEQFCRIWACKESALKLCGKGMTLPPYSFCVLGGRCFIDGRAVGIFAYRLENAFLANARYID